MTRTRQRPPSDRVAVANISAPRQRKAKDNGETAVRGVFDFATVADADRVADVLAEAGVRFSYEVLTRPIAGASRAWRVAS